MTQAGDRRPPSDPDDRQVTAEVGDEGGGPGDVEIETHRRPGLSGEATETWGPGGSDREVIRRDETGEGRRSP